MKKILLISLPLFVFILAVLSCKKEKVSDLKYGIDPLGQKSLLCRSLRIYGQNKDGQMPASVGSGAPIITSYPQAVEVSAGVLLYVPYFVSDTNDVCQIYIQIEGADNYWETVLTQDPTSRQPYFQILIPKFVQDGEFNLIFSVADCSGNVSPIYSTETRVSPAGDCNTSISGSVGITVRTFDMGEKAGTAGFSYEMYSVPDRLDIRYNGKWVASTGKLFDNTIIIPNCNGDEDGFVSDDGKLIFQYDPKINRSVEVYVSGCLSGTQWDVMPMCPQ